MKIWKLMGICLFSLALLMFIGCGEVEEEPVIEAEPEPEVVEVVPTDYTPAEADIGTEIVCPVCGMKMKVTAEMPAVTYEGKNYYFCSAEEKAKFVAAPAEFMKKAEEAVKETVDEATKKAKEATGH